MKLKDLPVQIKAGPDDGLDEGQFTAYASVFGNVDSYGDVVMPGAFAGDLQAWKDSGNPIPLLFGHNMYDPDFNIGHVTEAVEDDKGLRVTAQLDLENPKATQVYRMLKGRRVNQMSFAYDVLEGGDAESTDDATGAKQKFYELRKLKLYEVSVVTIGANQETEILAVKANAEALASGIKEGRVLAAKHIDSLRAAQEAIGTVITAAEGDDQGKASGDPEAKSGSADEEPTEPVSEAKSEAPDEEPKAGPSVDLWATHLSLLALAPSEEGVRS